MSKEDYINDLIKKTIQCPSNMSDKEIIKLYDDIQKVFKSFDYTIEQKRILSKKAHLESLAMLYDGINK